MIMHDHVVATLAQAQFEKAHCSDAPYCGPQRIRRDGCRARLSLRSNTFEDEGRRQVRERSSSAALIRLSNLTKSLFKSSHHKLPHPRLVARPRPGHVKDCYTMLFGESFSLSAAALSAAQRCSHGFLCFRANSIVFFDPPLNVGPIDNKTVASLSRTFHSVL